MQLLLCWTQSHFNQPIPIKPPPTQQSTRTHKPQSKNRDEHHGWQLYQSDPSGNYGGWKAVAIGNGHAAAQNLLKTEYTEGLPVGDAVKLLVKVLAKSMDSSLAADKVELATLTRDAASGRVRFKVFAAAELQPLLDAANAEKDAAEQQK